MKNVNFTVNGQSIEAAVEPRTHLADFLREHAGLTGTHLGCEHGVCGACTVELDGAPARSCIQFAVRCEGAQVRTIEGFDDDAVMQQLRTAFNAEHALQCGFCTPGMILRAHRLLKENPSPTEAEIRVGISGNICRCTGYQNIVKAIQYAASKINGTEFQEAAE